MAKYQCTCGEILSNVACPNNIEHYMLNDYQMDSFSFEGPITGEEIVDAATSVWKCSVCGRLTFFDNENKVTHVYVFEGVSENGKT